MRRDARWADTGTDPDPPEPIAAPPGGGEAARRVVPVAVGEVLAGKYRVERVLGMGGMGVVIAAVHVDLHERRAIKLMLPHITANRALVQRFRREARTVASLTSEHVTKVYDAGRLDDGTPYLVMEYLEGHDLRSHLEKEGPLPVAEAASYVHQTCSALAEAHAAGLVHRDIKPANLFLSRRGDGSPRIKLLDFGIVKATAETSSTGTGAAVGSALYMAPEQWNGLDLDARVDIWALGVVLYELCTGRPPFSGTTWPHLCALVCGPPPPPPSSLSPDLPPELDAIVLRCLEKDREDRWESVTALAEALAPLASSRSTVAGVVRALTMRGHLPHDPTLSVTSEIPGLPLTWSLRGTRRLALAGVLGLGSVAAGFLALRGERVVTAPAPLPTAAPIPPRSARISAVPAPEPTASAVPITSPSPVAPRVKPPSPKARPQASATATASAAKPPPPPVPDDIEGFH